MDEESDEAMAPMVDALTGAMSAVLLVSIFMILNSLTTASDALKEYGKQSLFKNEQSVGDVFNLEPPVMNLEKNNINFFKSFKLLDEQKKELTELFAKKIISKITVYSDESSKIITFNTLLFLNEVGMSAKIDDIKLEFLPSKN